MIILMAIKIATQALGIVLKTFLTTDFLKHILILNALGKRMKKVIILPHISAKALLQTKSPGLRQIIV